MISNPTSGDDDKLPILPAGAGTSVNEAPPKTQGNSPPKPDRKGLFTSDLIQSVVKGLVILILVTGVGWIFIRFFTNFEIPLRVVETKIENITSTIVDVKSDLKDMKNSVAKIENILRDNNIRGK